ncbi:MAG: DJ-1/PfpI family protein [Calothrix sp. MO_167.B12]|nr:DJ-1/PfpI family protein [Calothrix sp. MO_167.B12]
MSDPKNPVIGLVIYPGMTALDIVGPQQVFSGLPGVKIHRIWKNLDAIATDDGMRILPDTTFADCPPLDLICVGGGMGQPAVVNDDEVIDFFRQQSNVKFITSVCGGSEFLAKAGLLEGYRAATHWAARARLAELGVEVGTERVVIDRNRYTGGGVTAGIDFALTVAAELYGEETAKITQLMLEYDPAPPFDAGSPEKAEPELVNKVMAYVTQNLFQDKEASLS